MNSVSSLSFLDAIFEINNMKNIFLYFASLYSI